VCRGDKHRTGTGGRSTWRADFKHHYWALMLVHKRPFDRLIIKMLPVLIGWLPETEKEGLIDGITKYNWAREKTEKDREELFAITQTSPDTPLR
jgi:hypothetical protein